jgi:hypothetical protein
MTTIDLQCSPTLLHSWCTNSEPYILSQQASFVGIREASATAVACMNLESNSSAGQPAILHKAVDDLHLSAINILVTIVRLIRNTNMDQFSNRP